MRKALLIAFHYPPAGFSSGIHRSLKISEYLPDFGWTPMVLSASPRAYKIVRDDQLREIPDGILVKRAFALDTTRHLAIRGRYFRIMALPDPWVTWCIGGILSGLKIIHTTRPDVIWSTYPIATAHLIGLMLHRFTGIPWVADFRDSMTEENYPVDGDKRRIFRWIEGVTIKYSQYKVFTAPSTLAMYQARYPRIPGDNWKLVSNGYDEKSFIHAEDRVSRSRTKDLRTPGQIVLLHSGLLYPSERDPRSFFAALAKLKKMEQINGGSLRIVLRAAGSDDYYRKLILENQIDDIVFLESGVPYEVALEEMLTVDGLLIFQAKNCNHQIPAKIYEYFRAQRPILALTDPQSDTANLMRSVGVDTIVPLDDEERIACGLLSFLEQVIKNIAPIANDDSIEQFSRYSQIGQVAAIFDSTRGKN